MLSCKKRKNYAKNLQEGAKFGREFCGLYAGAGLQLAQAGYPNRFSDWFCLSH
jgi:hypothetical protein